MTVTWLITGANRGIGFELARQLLQDSLNIVLATARDPASAHSLHDLVASSSGRLSVIQLDAGDPASISASAIEVERLLSDYGLDYLVNNAGIYSGEETIFESMTAQSLAQTYQVNTIGPALISKAYLPFLERSIKGGIVVNISSAIGRFSADAGAIAPSYGISKAALNMLTYKQARERPGLIFIAMDPGWVRTDMGGPNATLPVEESASAIISTSKRLTKEYSGKAVSRDGEIITW